MSKSGSETSPRSTSSDTGLSPSIDIDDYDTDIQMRTNTYGVNPDLYDAHVSPVLRLLVDERGTVCFGTRIESIRVLSMVVSMVLRIDCICNKYPVNTSYFPNVDFDVGMQMLLTSRLNFETVMTLEFVYHIYHVRTQCSEFDYSWLVMKIKMLLSLMMKYRYKFRKCN